MKSKRPNINTIPLDKKLSVKKSEAQTNKTQHVPSGRLVHKPVHKVRKAIKRTKQFSRVEFITGTIAALFILLFTTLALLVMIHGDVGLFRREAGKKSSTAAIIPPNPAPNAEQDTKEPFQTTIVRWYANAGDDIFKPDPGNQFVIVQVKLVHHLNTPVWFAPVIQSYLLDLNGNKYEMAPTATKNPLKAGEYREGEVSEGELSYQLPLTIPEVQWCYRLDAASASPICKPLQ